MTLEERLSEIDEELGGFGPKTIQGIRETFDDEEEFEAAVRVAYEERDTDQLQQVPQIGHGYGLKLACWYANKENWEGGEAEPQPVRVYSGEELFGDRG